MTKFLIVASPDCPACVRFVSSLQHIISKDITYNKVVAWKSHKIAIVSTQSLAALLQNLQLAKQSLATKAKMRKVETLMGVQFVPTCFTTNFVQTPKDAVLDLAHRMRDNDFTIKGLQF